LFRPAGLKSTLAVLADTAWVPISTNAILTGLRYCGGYD
jgi:hypothetical protein